MVLEDRHTSQHGIDLSQPSMARPSFAPPPPHALQPSNHPPYQSQPLAVAAAACRCEVTGEGLPAAMLPYCGRSMLEGQVRDLQAQEYLYWHLTGTQVGWRESGCGGRGTVL